MEKRIFITGGSGFIGTNFIEHCKNNGNAQILNVDIVAPHISSHTSYWKNVNIMDFGLLKETVRHFNPTHVLHLAARHDLGATKDDYLVNTLGTANVINSLSDIHVQRVIFTSTMLICPAGYIPKDEFDYAPNTLYGESKMMMEKMIWERNLPYEWTIIRPSSIWGPWFKYYRDFFDRVIDKKMINIKNKACTKTFGFVFNSVKQISDILFTNFYDVNKKIFYIGDQPPIQISEWGNMICKELGYKKIPEFNYDLLFVFAKVGDILKKIGLPAPLTTYRLNNMTTNNILPLNDLYAVTGPDPYNLKEGIKITLEWMQSQGKNIYKK